MKIMHIAEPFATGVLSFLIDITKRQVEMNDIYSLWYSSLDSRECGRVV